MPSPQEISSSLDTADSRRNTLIAPDREVTANQRPVLRSRDHVLTNHRAPPLTSTSTQWMWGRSASGSRAPAWTWSGRPSWCWRSTSASETRSMTWTRSCWRTRDHRGQVSSSVLRLQPRPHCSLQRRARRGWVQAIESTDQHSRWGQYFINWQVICMMTIFLVLRFGMIIKLYILIARKKYAFWQARV